MVIISSPLAFPGATVKAQEVPFPSSLAGATSYVGHPATRALLEALGAETLTGKWVGPAIGEQYLAVPLAQNNREGGYTQDQAVESVAELRAILLERVA